ncbi:LacI family transcriptional regulator [Microbacterium sp. W4I4]|uniref:LacI family DNA-binding transcriptional regulator n=1 Tax=Microbacterium sp. W4I4 TaxID=3042295 RepID=UPI002787C76D|nr:LacI family DNA-binding transcriptional regulator [Microbacterium sp. W4I4]MDQ0614442.1 LacI family transcriptional regulator [Microbacterium sp. W4I4]
MVRRTDGPRRRTLQDVAEALGLTANTVSRALNDKSGVSASTRALIKAEAERIGYVPNAHARSLVLGSRKTIGVILTDLANPFFNDLVSQVEELVITAGYTLLLLLSDEDPERERAAVETALRSGVDGILGVPVQGRSNPWTSVTNAGIPLVLIARELPELDVDFYSTDNETGRRLGVEAAIERGARDIVLVEEDLRISTVTHRLEAFRRSLEANGIPFDESRTVLVPSRRTSRNSSLWRGEDAYRVISDLLDTGRVPEAFLVGNDYFGLGLYAALRERGVRVPQDTLVLGWGDYPFSRFLDPPLSTMRLPAVGIARRATERLLALIDGTAEPGTVTEYFPPELVLRGSMNR